MSGGKGWATAGFLLGIGAPVAGNVAHAKPQLGAQLAAAFYPVALLVTVEVLARVVWPAGRSWLAVRFGGAGLVALVAAVVSYSHLRGLLVGYGEEPLTSILGPLSVDGLMVVSGFALLATARTGDHVPAAANMAEDLFRVNPENHVATPALGAPEPVVPQAETVSVISSDGSPNATDPEPDPLLATARDRFAETLSAGSVPSVRAIRRELRVGHPRAVAVRTALSGP